MPCIAYVAVVQAPRTLRRIVRVGAMIVNASGRKLHCALAHPIFRLHFQVYLR